jgi:membrane-associated phospholipid phosphatase
LIAFPLVLLLAAAPDASPLELSWDRDAPIVGVTAALALTWIAEIELRRPSLCPCSTASIPGFDRVALTRHLAGAGDASDVLLVSLLVLGPAEVALGGARLGARSLVELLVVQAESMLLSASLTAMAKDAFARPSPSVYGSHDASLSGYESFWSGHAAAAFNAVVTATVLMHETYPAEAWPWIAGGFGIAAAGVTGLLRVTAGVHFPSDVIVGALVGSGIGLLVPLLHRRRLPVQISASPAGVAIAGGF